MGEKSHNNSLFDVTMGSYDGAEIFELVSLYILEKLSKEFGKDKVGLYRNDRWSHGVKQHRRKTSRQSKKNTAQNFSRIKPQSKSRNQQLHCQLPGCYLQLRR